MDLNEYEVKHMELLRKLAPECMVLLKSDGTFPLAESEKVALYGSGARDTIKGGTGSGDVNVRHFSTVEEGLENAGFTVTTKGWLEAYDQVREKAHASFVEGIKAKAKEMGVPAIMLGMGAVMPEPEYDLPMDGEGDLAVYVLGRISGEGSDRNPAPGDFELTKSEIRDILAARKKYQKFLLVLNVGGVVDLSPVMEVENILLLSQTGMTIGDSLADVLLGKAYPSGKLASTWAKWEDYCKVGEFAQMDDTRYKEGIYVGYRYFDTVDKTPMFPFGYGLGYTTFQVTGIQTEVSGTKVEVQAVVQNTGKALGKEVVQLYVSVPSGKLDQPHQSLAAFGKTKELAPGEEEQVTLTFALEELASFDSDTACQVLEAGDYVLRLGTSSRDTHVCGVVRLEDPIQVRQLSHIGGQPDFEDWKPTGNPYQPQGQQQEISAAPVFSVKGTDFVPKAVPGSMEIQPQTKEFVESLSDEELAYICLGGFQDEGSKSFVGNAGMRVVGAAGETTGRFEDRGLPVIVMADGPAGLRLNKDYGKDENGVFPLDMSLPAGFAEFMDEDMLASLGSMGQQQSQRKGEVLHQYCSAMPIGTALAQSWNLELCRQCGDMIGEEMERFGVHLWLAPALNIHRLPLCGRNFEYYSEDPLISGKITAALTQGVQSHPGRGTTIKHFACNNQETNRMLSNSIVSERALRDLYLKGFQIAVEESQPHALMTSYNLLNGEHTSQRRDLIMTCLRGEWGFQGLVMTDWVVSAMAGAMKTKYSPACASGSIKAGNDILMPGSPIDYKDLMNALNNPDSAYPITHEDLVECAQRIVQTAKNLVK